MAAILKAVGGWLKKTLTSAAKNMAMKKATEASTKHTGSVVTIILLIAFMVLFVLFIPVMGVISFAGAVYDFFENDDYYSTLTEEERNAIIYDAGELREFIKKMGVNGYTSQMFGIDEKTILRILDAVDVYNDSMENEIVIEYKQRVEEVPEGTDFPMMDPDTGVILESTDGIEGYKVYYEDYEGGSVVSRKNVESQQYLYGTSQNLFKVQWQPIMALCCMKIIANAEFWGTYTVEDGQLASGEPNYYLSDSAIQSVIDVFLYRYEFIRDIREDEEIGACSFDSFLTYRGYGFDLGVTDYEVIDGIRYRRTRRIPKLAPKIIHNSYVTYTYYYQDVEIEDVGLKGDVLSTRSIVIDAQALINAMKEEVPIFSESWFLSCLEQLPLTDEMCVYYADLFENPDEYSYNVNSAEREPVGGANRVFVFGNAYSGSIIERPDEGIYVPLFEQTWDVEKEGSDGNKYYHTISLIPGDWLEDSGYGYKYFYVRPEAITSNLGVDVVLKEKYPNGEYTGNEIYATELNISYLVEYCYEHYGDYPLFENQSDDYKGELVQCLYDFQTGRFLNESIVRREQSVAGVLGIMMQETGMMANSYARYWNFFSITTDSSTRPKITGTSFVDYKTWYENDTAGSYKYPILNAFSSQMYWIANNYWHKGQDTYYSMCFNGYDISNSEIGYRGIGHSYCPPWQDTAMPYTSESHDGGSYFWRNSGAHCQGWVNKCAEYKLVFEDALKFPPGVEDIQSPLTTNSLPTESLPAGSLLLDYTNYSQLEMKVIE